MATGDLTKNVEEISRFNPYIPERAPPDFTRASEGTTSQKFAATEYAKHEPTMKPEWAAALRTETDAPEKHATSIYPEIVDRSTGLLLTGLGNAAEGAITLGDQLYKAHIRSEVQDQITSVYNSYNTDASKALGLAEDGSPGAVPKTLEDRANYVADLKEARDNGTLTDTNFYGKLNVLAKEMRQRFPLYSEYVDKVVENAVGTDPARALRAALRNELNSGSEDTDEKRLKKLEDGNLQYLPPDYYTRMHQGDPYTFRELQEKVSGAKAEEHRIESGKAKIEADKAANEYNEEEASNLARSEIMGGVNNALIGVSSTFGKKYTELQELSQKYYADKVIDGKEAADLRAQWLPLRQSILDQAKAVLSSKLDPTDPHSQAYNQILGKDKLDSIMGSVDTVLKLHEDALVNANFGLLGSAKALLETMKDGTDLSILQGSDAVNKMNSVQRLLGPQVSEEYYMSPEGLTTKQKVFSDIAKSEMALDGSGNPLAKYVKQRVEEGNKDTKPFTDLIHTQELMVANQKATPQQRGNAARAMFTPVDTDKGPQDAWSFFTRNDQIAAYQRFTSPGFIQNMEGLKKDDPQAYQAWNDWLVDKVRTLQHSNISTMKDILPYRPDMTLKFNPDTNHFEAPSGGSSQEKLGLSGFSYALEKAPVFGNEAMAQKSLDEINTMIDGLVNVAKAQGQDPSSMILGTFASFGLDYSQKKVEQHSMWDMISNGLHDLWSEKVGLLKGNTQ